MEQIEKEEKSVVGKVLVKATIVIIILGTLLTIYFVVVLAIEGNSMR